MVLTKCNNIILMNREDMLVLRAFFKFLDRNGAYASYVEYSKKAQIRRYGMHPDTVVSFKDTFLDLIGRSAHLQRSASGQMYGKVPSVSLIKGAFIWANTKEGHNYWSKLQIEWARYIRQIDYDEDYH